ncbi:uncharacterized protein LOC120356421 [Nilaparvata lugens]|uniref:uncharacterized protein LOC120356421 n=1 Tax=Nilaparvata lugens TaxID=108931 RepID=UPI00193D349A|nr:uncharacterized protein LOC120356421 [Nilaparvata lugens]
MSQPGNRRRRRKHGKNKNEGPSSKDDNSRDELYDDFLLMFGESIDPIEIYNVLKKNDWKPEPSVDDLMAMSVSADSKKPPKKFDASVFEDDFEYATRASTSHQSAQNLNSYSFSPAKIRQYDGFHDAKVVYKGDNSEEEADADIIIEEEDVSTDNGLRVLQEFSTPFHKNVFMNACAANIPSSFDHVKQKENQPKTLNRDFEILNIENNSAFQKNSITQMYASGASNITEAYPPVESVTTSIKVIYEGCLEITDTVDRICSLVLNSIKVIVLLRGCPGSGKSYMAEKIISNVNKIRPEIELQLKNHVFSTDDYFMTPRYGYRFDPKMLPGAHIWNQNRAGKALMQNVNPVIIDNTNTQTWEMAPYVQAGVQYGYVVEILEPETKWKFNEYELFRRNIHGVPRVNIKNMLERYEHGITRNNIFPIFQYKYDPSKQPPQIVPDGEKNSRKIGSKVDTVQSNSYIRPANFPQTSNLPNSFPLAPQPASHGQEVDNNQPKNNLATQETNFSI